MKTHSSTLALRRRVFLTATAFSAAHLAFLPGCGIAQPTGEPKPATETAPVTPGVGDIAPDFELSGLKDEKIKLSTLTAKGPVVLVMLRGFPGYQCPLCTAQVGQFMGKAKELQKMGATVLMVYPGQSDGLKAHAEEFVRGKDMPANFYLTTDPDFSFTNLYNLRWNAKNETAYPSTFVLDAKRKVVFAKVSHSHGDRAAIEDVLAAIPK